MPPPPPDDDAPTFGLLDPDAGPGAPRLSNGQVLSARYRITRFIAGGGMGEVYEAEDLQLGGSVALKVVRGAHAGEGPGLDRLKREIQLARRVTHRNVCRLFEFGTHELSADGERPQRRVAFLTMELLSGETLSDRLRREGSLAPAEALAIAEQMAAALHAAHQAGVVHRDFKSGNVVLAGSGDLLRIVVTDFGLAHDRAGQGPLRREAEAVVGTPDYMAPEQIAGSEASPATDVYAFGLVLYEMAVGHRLFEGGTSGALRRLDPSSGPPVLETPGLDRRWQRLIQRCLSRAPEDRPASPLAVVRELRGEPADGARPATRAKVLAVAALLLTALGVGAWLRPRGPAPSSPQLSVRVRTSVAVLPFHDLGRGEATSWLRTALSEMLSTELAAGGGLRLVPGENVARLNAEQGLPDAESLAPDTLDRLRTNLGADIVVQGSYLANAVDRVRLDVRVQQSRDGETIAVVSEEGSLADVLGLVSRTGTRLRETMGLSVLTTPDALGLRASLPASTAALRPLAEGLARLRTFDAAGARERLEAAVAAEPEHPLAHAALAEAWSLLGHDDRARRAIQRALDLSTGLPREARLSIEARHREASRDWPEAVRIYDALFSFFPDNLEHGLRLASAQTSASHSEAARRTLGLLRRLPAPASEDPRLDLADAALAETLGDYRSQLSAAQRAVERGQARGERLLVARGRLHEAYAAGRLGRPEQTRAAADEARRIFEAAGDRGGLAWALNRVGGVLLQGGHMLEAERLYADSLRLFEEIGYEAGTAAAASNLHLTLVYRGELAKASPWLERAQVIDTALGNSRGLAFDLGNRALWLHEKGDLQAAQQAQAESVARLVELDEKANAAVIEQRAADTLLDLGRLEEAEARYRHALTALRERGTERYAAQALSGLGLVLRLRGDRAGARASHEEALRVRSRIGDRLGQAESRLGLARMLLDDGRIGEVGPMLEPALAYYTRERLADGEALGLALAAVADARAGRIEAAARSGARARERAGATEVPRVAARLWLDSARAARLCGRVEEAQAALGRASAISEAFAGLRIEARLERALAHDSPARAGEELARVEREAAAHGLRHFERIASQARVALAQR